MAPDVSAFALGLRGPEKICFSAGMLRPRGRAGRAALWRDAAAEPSLHACATAR